MKTATKYHGIMHIIFLVLLLEIINLVEAQWVTPPPSNVPNFSSVTMIIIIVIFLGGLLFIAIYSIYIRSLTNSSGSDNIVTRAGSHRSRHAGALGLDASVIKTFPIFAYSEVKDHKIGKGALECAVCLYEFQDHETLRLLPKCNHVFHQECVDPWLGSHVTCPVCRADLVPKPDDKPVLVPIHADNSANNDNDNNVVERSYNSRNGEAVVQVDGNELNQEPTMKRNLSFDYLNRLQKSRSIKMLDFDKFRSHSTGHTVVQTGDDLERYTLRLPPQVRKEVMHRATLSRAKSCTIALLSEGSPRKGYRRDESNTDRKLYQKIEHWSNRRAKSDSRNLFTGGFWMRSPKMGVEIDQESTSKGNGNKSPKKMSSFNCLEPKAVDEVGLFSDDQFIKSLA